MSPLSDAGWEHWVLGRYSSASWLCCETWVLPKAKATLLLAEVKPEVWRTAGESGAGQGTQRRAGRQAQNANCCGPARGGPRPEFTRPSKLECAIERECPMRHANNGVGSSCPRTGVAAEPGERKRGFTRVEVVRTGLREG